jgi:hypothetical protein
VPAQGGSLEPAVLVASGFALIPPCTQSGVAWGQVAALLAATLYLVSFASRVPTVPRIPVEDHLPDRGVS